MIQLKITEDIRYIGVNDHDIDLFEGQYVVENGMAYNSYVVLDEKIAVFDTVDARFGDEWLGKLADTIGARRPDYLIVQHMEPDHSANIARFMEAYPETQVVASAKAFAMMKQFFGTDYAQRQIVVGEGSTLALGRHTLTFVTAPMVHWPEVIVTYDSADKVLFSADGFGKFGALDVEEDWTCEARRYYIGIVGKYGAQVQALLKKAAALDIQMICPLHGFVWRKDIGWYLDKYMHWSSYTPEEQGVVIAYASIYGNTANAADVLACRLRERGVRTEVFDVSVTPASEIIAAAFKYSHLVFAAPTYNSGVFVTMEALLMDLAEHNIQNRTVAFMENGTWAATSARQMGAMLEKCKNLTVLEQKVTIKSSLKEQQMAEIEALADALV